MFPPEQFIQLFRSTSFPLYCCVFLVGNYSLTFPFYAIFHRFPKLPSLKLLAEVTILAKDKEPPTAQDGFEISLLSRICKSQERNPKRLFTNLLTTVLLFPCGSAMRTTLFVLAVSISLHCQMLLFPELHIAQVLDYVLPTCWLHWSYGIAPNP